MPPPQRQIAQWVLRPLPPPLNRTPLITNDTVRVELLSSLQLYSEIKDLGRQLLRRHGHTDLTSSFLRFQSYIRQSIAFFKGAEQLEYRASPLLFYYSFMDLAKAIVFLKDQIFTFGHIHHGLVSSRMTGGLGRQFTTIVAPGVFPQLYFQVTGKNIPNRSKVSIKNLLGYISDTSFEYDYLKFGQIKFAGCKYAIGNYVGTPNYRAVLAVNAPDAALARSIKRILTPKFSEINLDQNFLLNQFEMTLAEARWSTFGNRNRNTDLTRWEAHPHLTSFEIL